MRAVVIVTVVGLIGICAAFYANYHVGKSCTQRCFDDIAAIPPKKVGLVLGAGLEGNPFFNARIQAAVDLYKAGKVQFLLVSGDNGANYYDEVTAMENVLIRKGIPKQRIYKDHAGFRTLDSMIRAKKIFGQDQVIVVSQAFHNARALYLGDHHGLNGSIAFNARDITGRMGRVVLIREKIARLAAIIDVKVLHSAPRYLGEPILIDDSGFKEVHPFNSLLHSIFNWIFSKFLRWL